MAAKRDMLWLLVWRALRLRLQRVGVVFTALAVGATIVTALSAVWFDINSKMSEELRTFGANFYIGPGHGTRMPQPTLQAIIDDAPKGLIHGASPWLYGTARTELEKWRSSACGLSRCKSWCRTGRSAATGSASVLTIAMRWWALSWLSGWR